MAQGCIVRTYLLVVYAGSVLLRADEITLVNGDRITGAIVKSDGKTLTIKTEFLGLVGMPWDKVKTLTTDKPLHVVLPGGKTVQGRIETRDDKLEIISETERSAAARAEIAALRDAAEQRAYERLLQPGWTQLWAGTATLGLAGARGNAQTGTLITGLNAARVTNNDKTTVYFNSIRSKALVDRVTSLTAQAARGGLGYSRNITSRVALNAFNDYEYDRFQSLDLRFVLGAGASLSAWKSDRGRLDGLIGGAYNRESFSPRSPAAAFVRNAGEAYIGDDFTYKLTAVTAIYQNLRFFGNMSDLGRYRFNFDIGANTKLVQWLSWNIAISDRYLSSPVVGLRKNDFLYTTGIGVTFAR
jgi:hypothetical protein